MLLSWLSGGGGQWARSPLGASVRAGTISRRCVWVLLECKGFEKMECEPVIALKPPWQSIGASLSAS